MAEALRGCSDGDPGPSSGRGSLGRVCAGAMDCKSVSPDGAGSPQVAETTGGYTDPHPAVEQELGRLLVQDHRLRDVVEAWPSLPDPIRRAVLAIVESAKRI